MNSGHSSIRSPAKIIRATPMKPRMSQQGQVISSDSSRKASVQIHGISSSEYSAKHPKYPFMLNSKRRRPQLSREELMALYGTGNLLNRWEGKRKLGSSNASELSEEYLDELLSELGDEFNELEGYTRLKDNLLNWQNSERFKIPSVELSSEAEIQYENGVSLYESSHFDQAIGSGFPTSSFAD